MLSAMTTMFGSAIALQTGCEVRGLSNDAALLRLPRTDEVADHDQTRCDADTGLQRSAGSSIIYSTTSSSPARTARSASSSCACG